MVKQAFSQPLFKNCVLVDLLGGEPLLCQDILAIVGYLRGKGYLTNMSTNGLLLPKFIDGLKTAGISRINVSIYPTNLAFLKQHLAAVNKVYPVHNSYVLTRSELEGKRQEIIDLIKFARDAGSKSLRFWMFRPLGDNADLNEIVTDDLPAYQEFYTQVAAAYGDFILWPAIQSHDPNRKIKIQCRQLWQRIDIDADGNIGTCCGPAPRLRTDVNFFHSSADEIWNHPNIVDLRTKLLANNYADLPEYCKNCNLLEERGW